jgi:hypothetical protein
VTESARGSVEPMGKAGEPDRVEAPGSVERRETVAGLETVVARGMAGVPGPVRAGAPGAVRERALRSADRHRRTKVSGTMKAARSAGNHRHGIHRRRLLPRRAGPPERTRRR